MSAPELTLLTVCFGSSKWIRLNFELYRRSCPETPASWVVVENDPHPCEALNGLDVTRVAGPPPFPRGPFGASLHHAAGIQAGLRAVASRYLLILDPDFFPLARSWAKLALERLRRNDLAALGTGWEESDFTKPRGFPSPHFLLVDTQKIPRAFLDFAPDPSLTTRWNPLKHRLDRLSEITGRHRTAQWAREAIFRGTSHDTGSRISTRFGRAPGIRSESLRVVRKTWQWTGRSGLFLLDEVQWDDQPFAVHFRQVRAREHGEPWTLEAGKARLSETPGGLSSAASGG